MTDAIDLSADLPAETYDLAMLKPGTAEPNGWVVTLAGPEHPKAVAFKNVAHRERLKREADMEAAQMNGRKVKPDVRSAEEDDLRSVRWLVSRIVSWTPIKVGGETIAFSDEAAAKLLLRPAMAPYVNQITEYLVSERAFMPRSATN